jgi:hypothetical protein
MYLLTNEGDAIAWNVRLASHPTLSLVDVKQGVSLRPNEATTFMAAMSMGTEDATITVSWDADAEGTPGGEWRYPLP